MFDKDKLCPLLNKKCIQHECQWFVRLLGADPQTGNPVDEFGCAVAWLPILQIEGSQRVREVGAEIEKFNNQVHATVLALRQAVKPPPLSGNPEKDRNTLRLLGSETEEEESRGIGGG